jgi:hypothetical protein
VGWLLALLKDVCLQAPTQLRLERVTSSLDGGTTDSRVRLWSSSLDNLISTCSPPGCCHFSYPDFNSTIVALLGLSPSRDLVDNQDAADAYHENDPPGRVLSSSRKTSRALYGPCAGARLV